MTDPITRLHRRRLRLRRRRAAAPAAGPSARRDRPGHLRVAGRQLRPQRAPQPAATADARRRANSRCASRPPASWRRATCSFWPCRTARRSAASNTSPAWPSASSTSRPTSASAIPQLYRRYYGEPHAAPDWLERFAYGLPEINREAIRAARYVSGVAATPPRRSWRCCRSCAPGCCGPTGPIVVDVKAGSSEGGAIASAASHHPERSGAVRSFAPTGHRHEAEVVQALGRDGRLPVGDLDRTGARRAGDGPRLGRSPA